MTDESSLSEEALDRAREHLEDCRELAESDLPIAPYAEALVALVEEADVE